MTPKLKVGILGVTGTVGQRFVQLLEGHQFFDVVAVGASVRSVGIPVSVQGKRLSVIESSNIAAFKAAEVVLVFSALDAAVAGEIEGLHAQNGIKVLSNAKNYRMKEEVPLVVPLANPAHLYNTPIITNANCSTTGLVVPLKALLDSFGPITKLHVTTQQAISGAGYPGVPSLDIMDNVVPYISGEEEKMEIEPKKILGPGLDSNNASFVYNETLKISATCTRVPVIDGHTIHVSLQFATIQKPTIAQIIESLESYTCEPQTLNCPSAPKRAIIVHREHNRPQPRLDRDAERGYAVSVGRVRECPLLDVKFTVLVHNTVLGAAGSSILNAEICHLKGLI